MIDARRVRLTEEQLRRLFDATDDRRGQGRCWLREAIFTHTVFTAPLSFDGFGEIAMFEGATFEETASFAAVTFEVLASFAGAMFKGPRVPLIIGLYGTS